MDENFARIVSQSMLSGGLTPEKEQRVQTLMQNRWNCIFNAPNQEVTNLYKQKASVA